MKRIIVTLWQRLIKWTCSRLTDPEDTDNVRVRKITVGLLSLIIIPINITWTLSFIPLGLDSSVAISAAGGLIFIGAGLCCMNRPEAELVP